jgi:hypothetical protein
MDHAEKAQINPESLDYNQVVSELLTISSNNITEIPGMLQTKEIAKELESIKSIARIIPPEVIVPEPKMASCSSIEPKIKNEVLSMQREISDFCMYFVKCSQGSTR